jgi:hypothetical protein
VRMFELGGEKGGRGVDATEACGCPLSSGNQRGRPLGPHSLHAMDVRPQSLGHGDDSARELS